MFIDNNGQFKPSTVWRVLRIEGDNIDKVDDFETQLEAHNVAGMLNASPYKTQIYKVVQVFINKER